MDDDTAFSAANLSRLEEEEEYQEDGFGEMHLLDRPFPALPTLPMPAHEPRLEMTTRNQKALAGETVFPPCKDQLCQGCQTDCQKTKGGQVQLWCNLCQKGRSYLCLQRTRCLKWSEADLQRFHDVQQVQVVLEPLWKPVEPLPPVAEVEERRLPGDRSGEQEQSESSGGRTPVRDQERARDQNLSSAVLSVRPKILKSPKLSERKKGTGEKSVAFETEPQTTRSTGRGESTASAGKEGLTTPPTALSSSDNQAGVTPGTECSINTLKQKQQQQSESDIFPVRSTLLEEAINSPSPPPKPTRKSLNRTMEPTRHQARPGTYGAAALSPFHRSQDGENRMSDKHLFEGGGERREEERIQDMSLPLDDWDGQGLPLPSRRQPQQGEVWTQRRETQLSVDEDFYSPMHVSPDLVSQIRLLDDNTQPKMELRPARFLPPPSRQERGDANRPAGSTLRRPSPAFLLQQQARRQAASQPCTPPTVNKGASLRGPVPAWSTPMRVVGSEARKRLTTQLGEETWSQDQQMRGSDDANQQFLEEGGEPGEDVIDDEDSPLWQQEAPFQQTGFEPVQMSAANENQLQIARILQRLTERLDRPVERRPPPPSSSLKMPSLSLPNIRRGSNNEVSTRSYFQWKMSLSNIINLHGVSPSAVLVYYATTPRLLPEEFVTIMANSDSLQEAISSLDSLYPSMASIRPELIRSMTDLPPLQNASEKTRVHRISSLLKILDEFLKLFGASPNRDLNRQDVLVILHNFYGTLESRAELVKETTAMEIAKKRGVMYAESLKTYLTRTRTVLVDVISALQLVGRAEAGKMKSAAAKSRIEAKKDQDKKEEVREGVTCLLCTQKHPIFSCHDQLKLIRDGKKKLDPRICPACLQEKKSGHPTNCSLKRSLRDGVYILTNWKCKKGCSVHFRLCGCNAGPQQAVDPDQSKHQRSAAARVKAKEAEGEAAHGAEEDLNSYPSQAHHPSTVNSATPGDSNPDHLGAPTAVSAANKQNKEEEVVFLTENVFLLGQDGTTQLASLSYDTHGSVSFLAGCLSDTYVHSSQGSRTFQIDTVNGKEYASKEIRKVKILTLKGMLEVETVSAQWVDPSEEAQLCPEQAEKAGVILPVLEDEQGQTLPRIILSAAEILLHPRQISTPAHLAKLHPKISLFRSRLTNRLLCAGTLGSNSPPGGRQK